MKRPLLIIAVCLLLGAVVNVAVAWGCALLAPPYAGIGSVSLFGMQDRPFFHGLYLGPSCRA